MNGIIEPHANGLDSSREMAEPLHIQRLEAALDMRPFMQYAKEVMSRPLTSPEDSEVDDDSNGDNSNDDEDIATGSGVSKKKRVRKLGTKQGEFQCTSYLHDNIFWRCIYIQNVKL